MSTHMSIWKWTAVASLADTAFAGTYTKITTMPQEAIKMRIVSTLDASCMISLDGGTSDHLPIKKTSDNVQEVLELAAGEGGLSSHKGSDVHVKDIGTSTTGSIYVSFLTRI